MASFFQIYQLADRRVPVNWMAGNLASSKYLVSTHTFWPISIDTMAVSVNVAPLGYHFEVQANPNKKLQKKPDAIFSIHGKKHDYPMTFFLNSHLGPSRSWRSNDDWYWILRLRPRNFAIVSESFTPNLKKVRLTSVWQTVPKFWFIWLCYISYFTVLL